MDKYELVYIIDGHAAAPAKDEITKQVQDALAKTGIKVINSQIWMERHRMAFPINKIWEGTYYMVNIEAPKAALEKLQALLRINEQILRFMIVTHEPAAV